MTYRYKNYPLRPDRDRLISQLCEGKAVLHIGACDSPYTEEKLRKGLLLHSQLESVTSELLGVDIDSAAIEFLKLRGITNIVHCDFQELSRLSFKPEVIVFGETIEHLTNPGNYLSALKEVMAADCSLIISTPNCYSLIHQFMVLTNREMIHPDHHLGFSPGLLIQLMTKTGLSVEDLYFTFLPRKPFKLSRKIWRLAARLRKGWSETLVVVAKKL